MKEDEIPDKNIFMMCEKLNDLALTEMPKGFSIRCLKRNELDIWKSMPFDTLELAEENYKYMTDFFESVYYPKIKEFFEKCLVVVNNEDKIVATCFAWKAYEKITTIHWFKVLKEFEGKGIGRALLSVVMKQLNEKQFPIFLHTQPSSFRAIKLYSDFGFKLLSDKQIGKRPNHLKECLPILKEFMPKEFFEKLEIVKAPKLFLQAIKNEKTSEF